MLRKHEAKTMSHMVFVVDESNMDEAWRSIGTIVENDTRYSHMMQQAIKRKSPPVFLRVMNHVEEDEDSEVYARLNEYVIDSLGGMVFGME